MWKAGSRDKMIMGYLVRGSGIRGNYFAIQGQILHFFSLTFHVRVLSGDLRIAPRNFSAKEVLEIALKI